MTYLPAPYNFVCPLCTCATGDDSVRECQTCRIDACDLCIETWDDVLGDLCPTCRHAKS